MKAVITVIGKDMVGIGNKPIISRREWVYEKNNPCNWWV